MRYRNQLTRSTDESSQGKCDEEIPSRGFCKAMADTDEDAGEKYWRIVDNLRDRDSI